MKHAFFDFATLTPEVHSNIKILNPSLYFNFNVFITSSDMRIFATLCFAIHGSINSKCTSRERRGSKHDEGARSRKIYSKKRKKAERSSGEKQKGRRKKETELSSGSSCFLGVQRSLYGQAIFTTKPPGRAEVTREVTRYFRHVICGDIRILLSERMTR